MVRGPPCDLVAVAAAKNFRKRREAGSPASAMSVGTTWRALPEVRTGRFFLNCSHANGELLIVEP